MATIHIFDEPMAAAPIEITNLSSRQSFREWVEFQGGDISQDLPFVVTLNGRDWPKKLWDEPVGNGAITVTKRMFGLDPFTLAIATVISVGAAYYAQTQVPELSQQNIVDLPDQSPTYDANVQTNAARLNQPIPAGFGYHRIVPDLASQAYRRYVAGKQVLYHVLSIGHFEHTLHNPSIANTPFSSFEGIKHRYYKAGEVVDLFATDVVTSSEVERIQLYAPNDPDYDGPTPEYVVVEAGNTITRVEYDFVINGLYNQDKKTGNLKNTSITVEVSFQPIDEDDNPTDGWSVVKTHTYTDNTVDVLRFSEGFDITTRGKVRMVRTSSSAGVNNSRVRDQIDWSELRVFLESTQTYNHAVWAVEIPVTDQVGSRGQNKITVERQTLLPVWSGSNWTAPQATRNGIWALCAIAKASFGANYSDDRLNLAELKIEADKADARGDYFDYEFDVTSTVDKGFEVAARSARCEYTDYGNRISVVRDEYKTLAQMQFGGRQIERESFELSYPREDSDDAFDSSVEVEWMNPATWEYEKIICVAPGKESSRPFPWKFEGCTDLEQATREGYFVMAKRQFRGTAATFKTEMDGQLVKKGMPIGVNWAISGWGQSGEIIASQDADDGGKIITLSEPVEYIAGEIHQIVLRQLNGAPKGPYIAKGYGLGAVSGDIHHFQRLHLLPDAGIGAPDIYTGFRWDKTSFSFGPADKFDKRFKVQKHTHQGNYKYQITAVIDDPRVYQYDDMINNGAILLPTPSSPLGAELGAVKGLRTYFYGSLSKPYVDITWLPVNLAERYVIQGSKDNGVTWKSLGTTVDPWLKVSFDSAINKIRIAAFSAAIGPWVEKAVSLAGSERDKLRPNMPANLALLEPFVGRSCKVVWDQQSDAVRWQVSVCNAAGDVKRTIGTTNPEYTYKSEDAKGDGLGRNLLFKVWAVNSDSDLSFEPAELAASNPQIGSLANISSASFIDTAQISVDTPAELDFSGFTVWLSDQPNFEAVDDLIVASNVSGPVISFPIDGSKLHAKIAGADVWGTDDLAFSSTITFTQSLIDKSKLATELREPIELIDAHALKLEQQHQRVLQVESDLAATSASIENLNTDALSGIESRVEDTEQGLVAQSQSFQQLSSTVSGFGDSIDAAALAATEAKTTANEVSGIVSAQLTWKVQAVAGDGTVTFAGVGLAANSGEGSRVLLSADKIGFTMPGANSALAMAIENGKTVIAKASIQTLTANDIAVTNLSALAADMGTVTAGVMRSADGKFKIDLNNKYWIMEV